MVLHLLGHLFLLPHLLFSIDSKLQVILGDGTPIAPLRIYMTTLKMLRLLDSTNQSNMALYHLDGTYRITINNFPLSIYGRSDMNRKFFPIAIAMISSEKNEMLVNFFIALQTCARFFGINFHCQYIMIDAAPEEALAIRKAWPSAIVLMCWFHVKKKYLRAKTWGSS